ncbi:hypothetical protein P7M58_23565, partial [Vibrio parahaemolyticus]|nr:hypothetical protein [Vibrio parahaemolyticus]
CVQGNITLHSDNGAPMRSYTMLAKMHDPFSESLFKTIKYCPSGQWMVFLPLKTLGVGLVILLIGITMRMNTVA